MTRRDEHEQAKELAELWQRSFVPDDDDGAARVHEKRREKRLVGAIGDAIVREQGKRRRSRLARTLGALAVAASVLGAIVVGRAVLERPSGAAHPAPVEQAIGGVQAAGIVTLQRGRAPSVIDASPVHAGDRITTAVDATAALKLGETVQARVAEATEVSVDAPLDSTQRMRLDRGGIEATVDSRPGALPKLVVETPHVHVVVTGTVLQVEVLRREDLPGGAETRVRVKEGRVELRRGRGGDVLATVATGETWSSAPEPVPASDPAAALEPAAEKDAPRPSTGRLGTPAEPGRGSGTLAVENALFEAAVSARKRGSHHVALAHLDDLLTRYPGSPLAAEARLERSRALDRLGRQDDAASEPRRASPPAHPSRR